MVHHHYLLTKIGGTKNAATASNANRSPVYRAFMMVLGGWVQLIWWGLCLACAIVAVLTAHAAGSLLIAALIVAAFSAVFGLAGIFGGWKAIRAVAAATAMRTALLAVLVALVSSW